MSDSDISLLEYVKRISLQELRKNPDYSFSQIRVKANTKSNNGVLFNKATQQKYTNKCFFIAFANGLSNLGIRVNPITIANKCHMLNNIMIDTDNNRHKNFVKMLAQEFNVRIEIYNGIFDETLRMWFCSPDPNYAVNISANKIIRILSKNLHFEYIISLDEEFSNDSINSSIKNKNIELFNSIKTSVQELSNNMKHHNKTKKLVVSLNNLLQEFEKIENDFITIAESKEQSVHSSLNQSLSYQQSNIYIVNDKDNIKYPKDYIF